MDIDNELKEGLTEEGAKEAQAYFDLFIKNMKSALLSIGEETLADIYTSILPHIESDSWSNYRNQIVEEFCDYKANSDTYERDYKALRSVILQENREGIVRDLNGDLLKRIEDLEFTVKELRGY